MGAVDRERLIGRELSNKALALSRSARRAEPQSLFRGVGQTRGKPRFSGRDNRKLFMKLRVTSEVALEGTSAVGYSLLKENGLNGMLMGPRKLENNPELPDYIQRSLL